MDREFTLLPFTRIFSHYASFCNGLSTKNLCLLSTLCTTLTFLVLGYIYEQVMPPDPIYKQIGAVIRARRKKLGLKQETLAGMLGISRGALANVETGRQNVLVHQVYNIAASLDLSPFDLLPQPSTAPISVDRTELPLPANLREQQKEQITRLFAQVDTRQIREKKGSRGKV